MHLVLKLLLRTLRGQLQITYICLTENSCSGALGRAKNERRTQTVLFTLAQKIRVLSLIKETNFNLPLLPKYLTW